MLFIPPLILGLIIATMLAAAFHLWRGQTLRDFARCWLVAQAGFWATQFIARLLPAIAISGAGVVGELNIMLGLLGGLFALMAMIVRPKRV